MKKHTPGSISKTLAAEGKQTLSGVVFGHPPIDGGRNMKQGAKSALKGAVKTSEKGKK